MPPAHNEITLVPVQACDVQVRRLGELIDNNHRDVYFAFSQERQQVLPMVNPDVQADCGMSSHQPCDRAVNDGGRRIGAGADAKLAFIESPEQIHFPTQIRGASNHFTSLLQE